MMNLNNKLARRKERLLSIVSIFISLLIIVMSASSVMYAADIFDADDGCIDKKQDSVTKEDPSNLNFRINNDKGQEDDIKEKKGTQSDTTAFSQSVELDNVIVKVEAEEGVFPENSTLSVEDVNSKTLSGDNIALSRSFDIKVLNDEGNEIQPDDQIAVSFEFQDVPEKSEVEVYHEDEKLEPEVIDNTVVVESDGFSVYTVEFTYKDKQYVLKGDGIVKLQDLLDYVDIKGEISDYEVSNPELFDVYLGDDSGIDYEEIETNIGGDTFVKSSPKNKKNGSIAYIAALQPFKTEEWLDVEVGDFKYRITVTDDYVDVYGNNVSVSGVVQGGNEHNFTKTMPIADIFIDEDVVNMDVTSRNGSIPELQGIYKNYSEFEMYNPTGYTADNSVFLSLNVNKANQNGRPLVGNGGEKVYPGDIIKYTFADGAKIIDKHSGEATNYNLEITYSDLHVTLDYDESQYSGLNLGLFAGNLIGIGASDKNGNKSSSSSSVKYAIKTNVNVRIVDKVTGDPIDGTFYFPMVDIDVNRLPYSTFGNFYNSNLYNNYSEQVLLDRSTIYGDIYIPGGDFTGSNPDQTTNMPYLSEIEEVNGNLLFSPKVNYNTISGGSRDNDFYTGFATLADNSLGGINLTYFGSSASLNGSNYNKGINTYLMSGTSHINHQLVSSTGKGGSISTTRFGNHNGMLNDTVNDSDMYVATVGLKTDLTVATGQTVVYTMIPEENYSLKKVTINKNSTNINSSGTVEITPTEITLEDGRTAYIYEFADIDHNGSIHVEWEPDPGTLILRKQIEGSGNDNFSFKVEVYKDEYVVADTNKAIGDNYTIHADDVADYVINIQNNSYTIRNQNAGNYSSKESKNNGLSSAAGLRSGMGYITSVTDAEGAVYVYYPKAAKNSSGDLKDVWIKYDTTTIYPESSVKADLVTLYHGRMNGYPAFGITNGDGVERGGVYGITTKATIYITKLGSATGSATTVPTFTPETDGTVIISVDSLGSEYIYGSSLPEASEHNFFSSSAEINGTESAGAASLSVAGTTNGTEINLTGYPGSIAYLLENHTHSITSRSGVGGRMDTTTTGAWGTAGMVPDEGRILSAGGASFSRQLYVKDGKTLTYKLIPEAGYEIDSVTVNGQDVTASVVPDNGFYYYTLSNVTADTTLNVRWKTGTPPSSGQQEEAVVRVRKYLNLSNGNETTSEYINNVTLRGGDSEEFTIPAGWSYKIEEQPLAGWEQLDHIRSADLIESNTTKEAVFTNRKLPSLTIDKTTVGDEAGTFPFTVNFFNEFDEYTLVEDNLQFNESNGSHTLQYAAPSDGKYKFTVSNTSGENNIDNIDISLNNVSDNDHEIESNGVSFTRNLVAGDTVEVFIETTSSDTFTANIEKYTGKGRDPVSIDNLPQGASGTNGTYTFSLNNGGSFTFSSLPYGIQYEVTESPQTGWALISSNHDTGVLDADRTAAFLNDNHGTFKVVKIWEDEDDIFGYRPGSIDVKVTTDRNVYTAPIDIEKDNEGGGWVYEYNIPSTETIVSVEETTVPTHYEIVSIEDTSVDDDRIYTITNGLKTREVILQKNWADEDDFNRIRPTDLPGYIKYTVNGSSERTANTVTGQVIKGVGGNDNIWQFVFHIPEEAVITDWDEYTIPDRYVRTKSHEEGSNLYQMTNTLSDYDLTIEKKTIDNISGNFEFEISIWRDASSAEPGSPDTEYLDLSSVQGFSPKTDANEDGIADDGIYTFSLRNGRNITVPDVPYGYSYNITEILPDNWELVSKTHDSGQITQNTVSVFTNEYFPVLPTGIRRSFFWGMLIIPLMIVFVLRKRIIQR